MLAASRSRRLHRATSVLLAGLYAVVAMVGSGLHALGPCADGCGSDTAATVHDCGCGGLLCAVDEPAPFAGPTFSAPRPASRGHDQHQCAVCSLIAQLKVGHAADAATQTSEPVVTPVILSNRGAQPAPLSTGLSARGPPATT